MAKIKVAIIGAGAAGWFAAAAVARNCKNTSVTVYHDPRVPSIGVGESIAWGAPDFIRNVLGIDDESEFIRRSNATFKFAAKIQGWVDQNDDGFYIGYPYAGSSKLLERSPLGGYLDLISHNDERSLYDIWMHLHSKGLRTAEQSRGDMNEYHWFAKLNTIPIDSDGTFNTLGYLGHSYHVDAGVVGTVVHDMSGKHHGVKEVALAVKQVNVDVNGIESVILENDEVIEADLYIDCTGFERRLMRELDNEFVHCDEYFNNSAIVGPSNYTSEADMCSYTTMQALPNGWNFNVPINYRTGNGYIFNSRFGKSTDELVAEYESITGRKDVIKRHITWNPGYYKQCMYKNCIALGISYGFSEAFDANGFSSTLNYIKRLVTHLGKDDQGTFDWRNDFNYYTDSLVEDIKFRIQCAMHLAPRNDSSYWQEMKVAAKKFNTLEKLQDTIHSDERKKYLGYQNKMYSQHPFITTALYYGLDLKVPDWNIDERTEQLALNWFDFFNNKNKIIAKTSKPIGQFYIEHINNSLKF